MLSHRYREANAADAAHVAHRMVTNACAVLHDDHTDLSLQTTRWMAAEPLPRQLARAQLRRHLPDLRDQRPLGRLALALGQQL